VSKIAVVQHPPVLGNRDASIARATELAEEAAAKGAKLVIFPEAYVPGYPTYIWRLKPGGDMALSGRIHDVMVNQAVDLSKEHLDPLRTTAKKLDVDILVGCDEVDSEFSRSTLYNTYVHIDHTGAIANAHRKVMPTNPERMVWGLGDGAGIRVIDTSVGRVGSLICWESFMPLARMALYAQGVEIYVAPTWDSSDGWIGTMQHIAREGRCYVANCCTSMKGADVPADFPGRSDLFEEEETINSGKSCIVEPGGNIIAGPLVGENGIIYGDVDLQKVRSSRRSLDVAGHYNRPDIFRFSLDRSRRGSIKLESD
jgi:nitrilase